MCFGVAPINRRGAFARVYNQVKKKKQRKLKNKSNILLTAAVKEEET